jgi:photosystem II stability/assembly factor-like uncharacterized protein
MNFAAVESRISSVVRTSATRRSIIGAGIASCLAGFEKLATAATTVQNGVIDVLERPALAARSAASSPMLRVARCGRRLVAVGERGGVLLSDDDGLSWAPAQVPVSVTLTGVQFTSGKRGFAIGHSGVVLRTDDAGKTWKRVLDGRSALIASTEKPWLAMHFSDDQHGMIVGAFGMALETADGGQTWQSFASRIKNIGSMHLYALHKRGSRVLIAGEQGFFAQSVDSGLNFTPISAPYRGSFFALHLLEDERVLLGGLRGTLLLYSGTSHFRTLAPASKQGVVQFLALTTQPTVQNLQTSKIAMLDQSGRIFTTNVSDLEFKHFTALPTRTWHWVAQSADGAFVGASLDGVSRLQSSLLLPKT